MNVLAVVGAEFDYEGDPAGLWDDDVCGFEYLAICAGGLGGSQECGTCGRIGGGYRGIAGGGSIGQDGSFSSGDGGIAGGGSIGQDGSFSGGDGGIAGGGSIGQDGSFSGGDGSSGIG